MTENARTEDTPPAMARLIDLLIAKSVIDVIFVGALAVSFYLTAFNPHFRGWVDEAGPRWVRGWVIDQAAPPKRVEVQLYIDGRFAAVCQADSPRPDIVAAGLVGDENHGFFFSTPRLEAGEHEARVYAVHESGGGKRRTMQLIGRPQRFVIEAGGAEPSRRGTASGNAP